MAGKFFDCCECKSPIWLTTEAETALRESRHTFVCIWGHRQSFRPGDTEADVLRRERDRLKQQLAQKDDRIAMEERWRREAERRVSAAKGRITRLKNRAANGVCPCCNRTFANLQRHMQTKHAGFTAEPIDLDGATVQ